MLQRSLVVLFLLLVLTGCATIEERTIDKDAVMDETQEWFTHLDNADYEQLWLISSEILKLKTDKQDFLRYVRGIRKPLGEVIERDLQLNLMVPYIKHYPDGKYRKVVFWSKYQHKKFVKEYFLFVKEGEDWKVLRYDFM